MSKEYTIAVTGHRPSKLFGYDMARTEYIRMKEFMIDYLNSKSCTVAVS